MIWTKEEIDREIDLVRAGAREIFERDGEVRPMTFLAATRNPKTGVDAKGLVLCPPAPGMFESREGKDAYAEGVKLAAERAAAVGRIFLSEVWMARPSPDDPAAIEAYRAYAQTGKSLEHAPGRIEAVYMVIETHRDGTIAWYAEIARDAEGKGTLGEWQREPEGTEQRGRFARLLPPVA